MGRNAGMQGNFFGNPSHARSDRRGGMDLAYDYGPYAVKAEYMRGSVSDVTCDWWYAMAATRYRS